jgi:hypothetical protein
VLIQIAQVVAWWYEFNVPARACSVGLTQGGSPACLVVWLAGGSVDRSM